MILNCHLAVFLSWSEKHPEAEVQQVKYDPAQATKAESHYKLILFSFTNTALPNKSMAERSLSCRLEW